MSTSGEPGILVVDDERAIRFAFTAFFSSVGMAVDCAGSYDDALTCLERRSYGVVLADVRLEGSGDTTGLDVVAQARRRLPGCQIIVLTAYATTEMESRARASGANEFLHKPQSLHELAARVRDGLNRYPNHATRR